MLLVIDGVRKGIDQNCPLMPENSHLHVGMSKSVVRIHDVKKPISSENWSLSQFWILCYYEPYLMHRFKLP